MSDERIIVGLDIGTTKICTVIGEIASDGVLDIIGEGTVPSDGLRKGVVVNLERTIESVRQSVAAAGRVAGVEPQSAWVGIAGTHLKAITSHGMAAIRRNQEITRSDVDRTVDNAKAVPLEANMEVLHVIPQEYVVDGHDGIKDPVGMSGVRLEVDVHLIAGSHGPLQNLRRCATDAGIAVDGVVVQAMASGLAVLGEAEREVTALLIDIGGGTTDIAIISLGGIVVSESLRIAGNTFDAEIVRFVRNRFNLLIGDRTAEEIKRTIGTAVLLPGEEDEELEVRGRDLIDGMPKTVTVASSQVVESLTSSLDRIGSAARHVLEQSPPELISDVIERGIVLTGGGSQLRNLDVFLQRITGVPVMVADEPADCVVIGTSKALEMSSLLIDASAELRRS